VVVFGGTDGYLQNDIVSIPIPRANEDRSRDTCKGVSNNELVITVDLFRRVSGVQQLQLANGATGHAQ
jgi:hypothetical protein